MVINQTIDLLNTITLLNYLITDIFIIPFGNMVMTILVIIESCGSTGTITEKDYLAREQYYFDLYEPVLDTKKRTDSTLGFKHTETSERLIPDEVYKR